MKQSFTRAEVYEILTFVADEVACLPGYKGGSDPVSQFAEGFNDGEHDGDPRPLGRPTKEQP